MWFLVFIVWIVLTVVACKCARDRGRSPGKWLVFCLFITPIIALIAIFCSKNLKEEEEKKKDDMLRARVGKREFSRSLNDLSTLRQQNVINNTEFSQKKIDLINNLYYKGISDSPESFLVALVPFKDNGVLNSQDMEMIKGILYRSPEYYSN